MRNISDTYRFPPRNGERFRDGEHVVEYRELDGDDKTDPCDVCCYDNNESALCDGGRCVRFEYADLAPIYGYYSKINKE
jgi:hypothetical protein